MVIAIAFGSDIVGGLFIVLASRLRLRRMKKPAYEIPQGCVDPSPARTLSDPERVKNTLQKKMRVLAWMWASACSEPKGDGVLTQRRGWAGMASAQPPLRAGGLGADERRQARRVDGWQERHGLCTRDLCSLVNVQSFACLNARSLSITVTGMLSFLHCKLGSLTTAISCRSAAIHPDSL
jgi:hypothetical protein